MPSSAQHRRGRGWERRWLLALLLPAVALAHHSFAQFDSTRTIELKGSMRALEWQNPHSWIWIDVPQGDGSVQIWGGEFGGGPSSLPHDGFRRQMVQPGDQIVLTLYPARDGSRAGSVARLQLASGQVIAFHRPQPPGPPATGSNSNASGEPPR